MSLLCSRQFSSKKKQDCVITEKSPKRREEGKKYFSLRLDKTFTIFELFLRRDLEKKRNKGQVKSYITSWGGKRIVNRNLFINKFLYFFIYLITFVFLPVVFAEQNFLALSLNEACVICILSFGHTKTRCSFTPGFFRID